MMSPHHWAGNIKHAFKEPNLQSHCRHSHYKCLVQKKKRRRKKERQKKKIPYIPPLSQSRVKKHWQAISLLQLSDAEKHGTQLEFQGPESNAS